jgi:hypothetical protein
MALALSMKVNTSVTQLDLDSVPKKKLVSVTLFVVFCDLNYEACCCLLKIEV